MDSTSRLSDAPPQHSKTLDAEGARPRKRVLFIAYEYPPLGGAGVRRSLIFSKYLSEFGIEPVILTTDLASLQRDKGAIVDSTLLQEVPHGLIIERIPTAAPRLKVRGKLGIWMNSFFVLTDTSAARWQTAVRQRLPELITKYRPRAIYVTLPPFSMASLASSFGEQTKLPVLLDFRDSWSQCGFIPFMSWIHYRSVLRLERDCLSRATAVVCVTDQIKRDMLAAQPSVDATKFCVIPNGFDGEIPTAVHNSLSSDQTDPYVIGHVGSFYYSPAARQAMLDPWWRRKPTRWTHFSPRKEDWLYRSPYFFFRALVKLFQQKPVLRKRIRVRFVGAHPQWLREQVVEFKLQDVVEFLGYLSHQDCLAFQASCDCLLITSAKVIGGEDYCISSKTFEYIGTGKPVLAVVAPGAQRDFLVSCGMAQVCDPDDSAATAVEIEKLILGQIKLQPDRRYLAGFHGRAISHSIADLLHKIAAKAAPASS